MRPFRLGRKAWDRATVVRRYDERSYEVETNTGNYRRNRVDLRKSVELTPESIDTPGPDDYADDNTSTKPVTRQGAPAAIPPSPPKPNKYQNGKEILHSGLSIFKKTKGSMESYSSRA